jgi:hypothetical protein
MDIKNDNIMGVLNFSINKYNTTLAAFNLSVRICDET